MDAQNIFKFIYPLVSLCATSFVAYSGYCVYQLTKATKSSKCAYDMFEKKLMEILQKSASYHNLANLKTPQSRRDYFMKKMCYANKCIEKGDEETALNNMIEAMAACSRPVALLECMSRSLPKQVYKKLLDKLVSLA